MFSLRFPWSQVTSPDTHTQTCKNRGVDSRQFSNMFKSQRLVIIDKKLLVARGETLRFLMLVAGCQSIVLNRWLKVAVCITAHKLQLHSAIRLAKIAMCVPSLQKISHFINKINNF